MRLTRLLVLVAAGLAACSDAERSQLPPSPPATIRDVPYDVGDTSQPGQLSIFNARPGGGSVGMPVRFGDVDGDGAGDFVACPMLADSGPAGDREDSGEVHVYYGNGVISGVVVNAPGSDAITTIMGARPGDLLGNEPDVLDLDRDGFADLIIGAQNYDGLAGDRPGAGGVFVYFGRSERPRIVDLAEAHENVVRISGAAAGDRLGIWVTAGDVDADGALDLLLGADQADGPDDDRPDSGAVYVVFGGQKLPAEIDLRDPGDLRWAVIHGIDPGDHFGSTIRSSDLDGDGDDDTVAAGGLARGSSQVKGTFLAGGDGPDNQRANAGEVYVLFSPSPFPAAIDLAASASEDRVTIYGAEESDVAGEELAIGDLDGDGLLDVAIGSLRASGPGGPGSPRGEATGRTYIVFDAASRRGQTIDLDAPGPGVTTIYGARREAISGDTLVIADMDGDGFGDLWDASPSLGTRSLDGAFRPASGELDVIFGQGQWPVVIDLLLPPDDLRLVRILGPDANDQFAYGLGLGDADGDGRFDIIANAMAGDGFENGSFDAGELYVLSNQILFDSDASARSPLYLNVDIQPILEATCLPCHAGEDPAAGLRLDSVQASIDSLLGPDGLGRRSAQVGDLLVTPGDPDASYLVEKIEARADDPPRVGSPMPEPPLPSLPARAIGDVRRWISEGALPANEELPPPPPPPAPPGRGFSATFFAQMRFVLSDPALGDIESRLLDPPGPIPLRLIGPRLIVPAVEFPTIKIPGGQFGDVDVLVREDGVGTFDRATGEVELAITFVQLAIEGTVETLLPVTLTTGTAAVGPFASAGQPYDPIGGTLRVVGVGRIPASTAVVGGDPVLVELEGSVLPLIRDVPTLEVEIQPILSGSCALVNCHVGDGAAGLNLEPGRAFGELIGVPSTQVEGSLVSPGDPASSYLLEKLVEPRIGVRMPIGNRLDPLEIEAIRQWIAGGAPD